MASINHTIKSQVPSYILQEYPRFVDFLEGYYAWMSDKGSPYHAIKNHLDYLNFKQSIDEYVTLLQQEYLSDVPEEVLIDKELFIKWSKKFNISRGSHASYKFLFRLLFSENDTEIFLPKENILRPSDGSWSAGESVIVITNSGNADKFLYQRIMQKRQVYENIYEYAYATVQRAVTKYAGRYFVTELYVTDVDGKFKLDWPIQTEQGDIEWPIPTVESINVTKRGVNHFDFQRLMFNDFETFKISRKADIEGEFDTRITSFLTISDIKFYINGQHIHNIEYDGRTIKSNFITKGVSIDVILPSYEGYTVINEVDSIGSVLSVEILDSTIGIPANKTMKYDGIGGGKFECVGGVVKPESGKYQDTQGHLSSDMYLQDSYYYQDFSYVIKTNQDIATYGHIVKQIIHPSGFEMFGEISIIEFIKIVIGMYTFEIAKQNINVYSIAKYGLGANHSFIAKFLDTISRRVYKPEYHFRNIDPAMVNGQIGYRLYDWNMIWKNLIDLAYYDFKGIDIITLKPVDPTKMSDDIKFGYTYYIENGYILPDYYNDKILNAEIPIGMRIMINRYIDTGYIDVNYFDDVMTPEDFIFYMSRIPKGWMTKLDFGDADVYIPQSYSEEKESGNQYFENGYLA